MKNTKTKPSIAPGVALSPQLLATLIDPNDCFGTYEVLEPKCVGCHDKYACGMFQQYQLKTKVVAIEKENGPFLDQTKFPNEQELFAHLVEGAEYDEVINWVKSVSICPDPKTIEIFLDGAIRSHSLRVKAGVLCL